MTEFIGVENYDGYDEVMQHRLNEKFIEGKVWGKAEREFWQYVNDPGVRVWNFPGYRELENDELIERHPTLYHYYEMADEFKTPRVGFVRWFMVFNELKNSQDLLRAYTEDSEDDESLLSWLRWEKANYYLDYEEFCDVYEKAEWFTFRGLLEDYSIDTKEETSMEILQTWMVNSWMGWELIQEGEPVLALPGKSWYIWGRRTCGAAMYTDEVFTSIRERINSIEEDDCGTFSGASY